MADISKVTLPSGTSYNLKDAQARSDIETIKNNQSSAMHYIGTTTTPLSDGAGTNPITIGDKSVTVKSGDVAIYQEMEFIFSGTDNQWHEYGSTGSLKALAFKDSASGSYKPAGGVSQPTFNGTEKDISLSVTPSGNVTISEGTSSTKNYTPKGTVSTPTITVTPNTSKVNSITDVGTLPTFSATVANENLTLAWTDGTLPTKGSDTTVVTGIKSATATQPTFTGTGADLKATFTGTAGTATGKYKPEGTVTKPTFTGTQATIEVS